ncbi:MAG: hypothetical protein CMN56_06905 [Sneathiella sp.]|nr:hypothetical protein [Sneathiella sp.]
MILKRISTDIAERRRYICHFRPAATTQVAGTIDGFGTIDAAWWEDGIQCRFLYVGDELAG